MKAIVACATMAFVFLPVSMSRARRRRWQGRAFLTLLASLILSLPVGPFLVVNRDVPQPEAILALGSHEHERLPEVARQAARHQAARVLLTLPVSPTPHNCQECSERTALLVRRGVASPRIQLLTPRVRNTWDELRAAAAWADRHGVTRILVVTSPYHTRRASHLARRAGSGVAWGIVAAPVADGLAWPWWSRRYDRRYVVYECAALLENSWRHRTWRTDEIVRR